MMTLGLLFLLAAVGGAVVWNTMQGISGWAPATEEAAERPRAKAGRPQALAAPGVRRRLDVFRMAGVDQTSTEPRPTLVGRLLALGRLILFVLFICAVAGGGLMWIGLTLARLAGLSNGR